MTSILFPPGSSIADMLKVAQSCQISDPRLYVLSFDPSCAYECNLRILQAFGLNPKTLRHDIHSCYKIVIDSSSLCTSPKYPSRPVLPSYLCSPKTKGSQYISLVTDQGRLALISSLIQNCLGVSLHGDQALSSLPYQPSFPGTYGWDSFDQLFSFLSKSVVWCLLRNHEYHADGSFWECDSDLDILSPKLDLLICACNAKPRYGGISSHTTIVEGRDLNLDLRSIGDKYYDPAWAIDILRTRVKSEPSLYRPSSSHYLYMLIYHSLLQKRKMSDQYYQRISSLSSDLCLNWNLHDLDQGTVLNFLLKSLDYFLSANNYVYTYTTDAYVNIPNIAKLKSLEVQYPGILFKPLLKRLFHSIVYRTTWKLSNISLAYKTQHHLSAHPQSELND